VTAADLVVAQADAILAARRRAPALHPLARGWCAECLAGPEERCTETCLANTAGSRRVR
jgi:hypothetical protein